ncbi:hypothetical protein DV735_g2109, partial [Chaetothyriales sp. CBS 134920]
MASQQQPPLPAAQHRPPYPPPTPSLHSDHRASPINPQPAGMLFSSPPPQAAFSPQFGQPPAAKRPRLSPDVASPFHTPSHPQPVVGQTASPAGAVSFNHSLAQPGPGSMPPPQRPIEREREGEQVDGFENDIMRRSGVDLNQEEQNVAASNIYPGASFRGQPPLVGNTGAPVPAAVGYLGQQPNGGEAPEPLREPGPTERQERLEARADWEASRHRQFPLWDMFLYGGPLNDRIREKSQQERLQDPQAGVLINTQRTGPPPRARVNGFEGATREIDKGQAILDSGAKGERLREIMSIISLATKTRLTGVINASARLAMERRQHSKGQVPAEWADISLAAVGQASTGIKGTNDGSSGRSGPADLATGTQLQASGEEEARRAKRAKRKSGAAGSTTTDTAGKPDVAAMEAAVAAESSQKMTKKAQKEIAGRAAEQVAHASANEAARMAISGMMGSRFGSKKNRTYDWLTTGKSGSSTPTRVPSMTAGSVAGTPSAPRAQAPARENKVGPWDEDKEPGIQVRDVLLVLESDGRAPKTYLKALEKIKD